MRDDRRPAIAGLRSWGPVYRSAVPAHQSTVLYFAFGLALAACTRDQPQAEAEAEAGPSQACIERTSALSAALAEIPAGGFAIVWPANVLVVLDEAVEAVEAVAAVSDAEDGLVIYAHPDGFTANFIDQIGVTSVAEARDGLKIEFEKEARAGGSGHVLVVARRDATWDVMVTLFAALRELGETEVDLVFARDVEIPPTPPSAMTEELIELRRVANPNSRSTQLAKVAAKLFEPCPPLIELFSSIATLDPDTRQQTIVSGTPTALQACDCKADVESVTALLHTLIAPDFVSAVVRLQLAPASEAAEELALPGSTTWQEAHVRVVATRDRPSRFAVQTR